MNSELLRLMNATPEEPIIVFITAANRDEAAHLAEMLVGSRLAACVQILPEMQSVYRWQGKIEHASEVLVIAKTVRSKFEELEKQVLVLHSYETPEIVACPLTAGSAPYLKWLSESMI